MPYVEEQKTIDVPPATGVPGYLKVIAGILERPRVQEIVLSKTGKITYRRFRGEDEPDAPLEVELESLMPFAVIRNSLLEELPLIGNNAAIAVSQLFTKAHMDGMSPLVFASGPGSLFFAWHARTTSVVLAKTDCYGLPFLPDPELPNEALFLCAGYSRRSTLPDTVRSYKITIPFLQKESKP